MDLDVLTRNIQRALRRRQALKEGGQLAQQILDLVLSVHRESLVLVYDPTLVIQWVAGSGWVIPQKELVGKTLREAFGPAHADALEPHYRRGLRGQHDFEYDFEGHRWRSVLRPLIVVEAGGLVGGVLLSHPLGGVRDPTQGEPP